MNKRTGFLMAALFTLTVLAPTLASANEPVHSLQELQTGLQINDTVRIVETSGNSFEGKVESLSGTSLKVRIKGVSREFREPQILMIRKRYRDPITNGVTIPLCRKQAAEFSFVDAHGPISNRADHSASRCRHRRAR